MPTWITDHGYTGHEHIWCEIGATAGGGQLYDNHIINMNGRLYDPQVGRMFSPDPYIPDGTNSQDYNKYIYARNNPLKYTDPDGEWVNIVVGAVVGGVVNLGVQAIKGNVNTFGQGLGYFGVGAAAGAIAGATGVYVGGIVTTGGFAGGAIVGGASGLAGGFVRGAGNSWVGGATFGQGLGAGLKGGIYGAIGGAVIGGVVGGVKAEMNDQNFWTGKDKWYKYGTGDPGAITRRRFPSFKRLWKNYPHNVNGQTQHPSSDGYPNQCAIRLGKTLQQSDVDMSNYDTGPVTSEGYPRGSKSLADWLWREFGAPEKASVDDFNSIFNSNTGIMYESPVQGGIGHIDLFNMGQAGSGYYTGGVSEIWYWLIK